MKGKNKDAGIVVKSRPKRKRGDYHVVFNSKLVRSQALTRNARLLYLILKSYADAQSGEAWPSIKKLCSDMGELKADGTVAPAGYRLVKKAIDELVSFDLVSVEVENDGLNINKSTGRFATNQTFYIHYDVEQEVSDPKANAPATDAQNDNRTDAQNDNRPTIKTTIGTDYQNDNPLYKEEQVPVIEHIPSSSTLTARVDDDDDGVKRFELREKISAWYQSEDAPVLTDDVEVGGKEIGELCKQYKHTYKLPKFYERVFGEYIPSGEIDETLIQELFAGLLRAMQPEGHSISLRSHHATTIQGVTIEQLVDVLPSWLSGAHHKTPQSLAKWAKNNQNQGASHGTDRSRNAKFSPSYSPGTIESWKPSSNGNSFMEHYGSQA